MAVDLLPNELWKDIIDHLEGNMYSLQELRLVNQFFNDLVTPVLFKGFNMLKLGNNYEDSLDRLESLLNLSPYFRSRIKYLNVPRGCLNPLRSRIRYVRNYVEIFAQRLGNACNSVGFRFSGVIVGGISDYKLKDSGYGEGEGYYYKRKKETGEVLRMLGDLVQSYDSFRSMKAIRCVVFREDIPDLISKVGEEQTVLLQRFEAVDMRYIDLDVRVDGRYTQRRGKDNFVAIGGMLRSAAGRNLKQFCLSNPDPDYVLPTYKSLWDTRTAGAVTNLQHFALAGYTLRQTAQLVNTLKCLPNLRSFHFAYTRIACNQRWGSIFDVLLDLLPDLTSVFFEDLKYDYMDNGEYERPGDEWEDAKIKDLSCGNDLGRPIVSPHSEDVKSLKRLLGILIDRREKKRLALDPWMSVFCQRSGVIVAFGSSYIQPGPDPALLRLHRRRDRLL